VTTPSSSSPSSGCAPWNAHGIGERAQTPGVGTEDLREALLRYRSLFDELLRADDGQADVAARHGSASVTDEAGADRGVPDRRADGQDAAVSPDMITGKDGGTR